MNGHAHQLLTSLLRVDGSSPLVRVDTDAIIQAAAGRCTVPLERVHDEDGGTWSFTRGQRVPGGTGAVFGLARCSRCRAHRDAVIGVDGRPLCGPVFEPAANR